MSDEQAKPRMPRGLGAAGKRLWTSTIEEFALEAEPHKLELLGQACKIADQIAELDKARQGQPLTVKGSMGQQVISPLVAEARTQRVALAQLLGKLGLPDSDEEQAAKAEKLSQTRSRAARRATLRVIR